MKTNTNLITQIDCTVHHNTIKRSFGKRTAFLFLMLFSLTQFSFGQLLQWNTFGNVGTETTEPSVFNDANIAGPVNITWGPGIVASAANANRFGGNNWFDTGNTNPNTLAESVTGNNYLQFIVTPNAGFSFTPTSFVFVWDRSSTGPANVALRSSADGFTTDLGIVTGVTGGAFATQTITISGLTTLTTATTFRIYGYGATATGGTGGFDIGTNVVNVQLNGTTTTAGLPSIDISAAHPTAANINQGSFNNIIGGINLTVTVGPAVLTGVTLTTAGTYAAGDIMNNGLKVWLSNSATSLSSPVQLGTSFAPAGTGSSLVVSGLNQTIPIGTKYILVTADITALANPGATLSLAATPFANITFTGGTKTGTDPVAGGSPTFDQTIAAIAPTIDLANGTVAAGSIIQNTINNLLYRIDVTVGVTSATLTDVSVTTAGTYVAADLTNIKLWSSASATFSASTSTVLATNTTGLSPGAQAFSSLNYVIPIGTQYLYVTADVPCAAVAPHTINVNDITTSSLTFAVGTPTGTSLTAGGGGTKTITEVVPFNVSGPQASATLISGQLSVSWTNPTSGCFSDIMIVASPVTNTTFTPTGDGTAYTANLAYGTGGTAVAGGFVVYKGSTSPQLVTGLTNGVTYFFKFFSRNGSTWSAGTEVSGTPNEVLYINYFTGTGICPTQGNVPSVQPNATGTALSRNTIVCTTLNNGFNSTTLNVTAAVVTTSYIEFSVSANAGFILNLTSLTFFRQASGTAPNQLEVKYSTDGFATSTTWGSAPVSPTVGDFATWNFPDFSTLNGGTVTFRIYPYGTTRADLVAGAASATGTLRLDDVTVTGTVSVAPTPSIALSAAHPAAANIAKGSNDNIIGGIRLDVTLADATLTGVTVTTAGTFVVGDIAVNGLKLWLSPSATSLSGATQLGASLPAAGSGGTLTASGLSVNIPIGTPKYILATASILLTANTGNTLRLASTDFSNITFTAGTKTGTDPVAAGATPGNDQTIAAIPPTIVLANGGVAGGNITQNTINNVLYRIDVTVSVNSATLTGVSVPTAGTYVAADLTNLRLWSSASTTFSTASATLLATNTTGLGAGTQTFSSLSQSFPIGTEYLFISADVPCAATTGHTINVGQITTSGITFASGTPTPATISAGATSTIVDATPVDATAIAASGNGNSGEVSVSWTNPVPCYTEIMIVASPAANTTFTPTGNGSAYTANLAYGTGTAVSGGFVAYKGSTSPQVVTGLTNGTPYYFKIFTRNGSAWSTGVEVTATPALIVSPDNIVVLQVGNGTDALSANGNALFLQQYTTTGTPVSTVTIPTSGCTPLISAGNSTTEGYISRSADNEFILIPGYVSSLGALTGIAAQTAANLNRGIGRVDANGNYTLPTKSTTAFSGQNIRGAVSDGNNNFWATGSGTGVSYFGTGTPATVSTTVTNLRVLNIHNGDLYYSTGSGTRGIYKITGLPILAGAVATNIIDVSSVGSPYGFQFNSTFDVCYISDDRTIATGGGIQKWVFSGSWSLAYTIGTGTGSLVGARGLAVNFLGTYPVLYATTADASSVGNRLIQITDFGTKTAADASYTLLATSPATTTPTAVGSAFRGVTFAPIANCPSAINIPAPVITSSCGPNNGSVTIAPTGGTAPYTYAWSNAAGTVCTTSPSLTGVSGGTYTVIVTDQFGSCAATATATVPQLAAPSPVITGTPGFCTGFSTTLNAGTSDGGGSYTAYSWSPGGSTSSTLSVNTATTYTVTVTNTNNCTTSATVTVSQFTSPTPAVSGNTTICSGGSTVLNAGGPYNQYQWSPGGATTQTINASTATTYTVTITDVNGCTGVATSTVTSVTALNPVISGSQSFCPGGSSVLSVPTGFASYQWSPVSSTTNTALATTGTTYSVTVSDGSCTGTSTVTIVINPVPTISVSPPSPSTVCKNTPVSLTGNGGVSYTWSPSTGLNVTTGTPVSATPASTTTYIVTGTNSFGCTNTSSVTVTINQLPVVAVNVPVTVICAGEAGPTLVSSGATSYTWSPGSYLNTTTGSTVTAATPLANVIYTVSGTDGNGCVNTASAALYVIPRLNAPAANTPIDLCQNTLYTLTATTNPTTASLLWYTTPTYGTGSSTPIVPNTTLTVTTNYYVTQTINNSEVHIAINGLADNRNPDLFNVLALTAIPNGTTIYFTDNGWTGSTFRGYPTTGLAGAETICKLTTTGTVSAGTVMTSYTNGGNYAWTSSGVISGTNASAANSYLPLALAQTGDQIYAFMSSNPANPLGSVTKYLFVLDYTNGFEPATIGTGGSGEGDIPPTLSVLEGTAVTLAGFTTIIPPALTGQGTYISLINDGAYRSAAQWYDYIKVPANYTLVAADLTTALPTTPFNVAASCESPFKTIVVNVNPAPVPGASSNSPVCTGNDINLFSDPGQLYSSWDWSGPNLYTSADREPVITGAAIVNGGVYTVTVTDGNNCTASQTVTVDISCGVPLYLKVFIEGYYEAALTSPDFFPVSQMRPCLYSNEQAGTLPVLPFPQGPYAITDCDYIDISAMSDVDGTLQETQTGLLQTDGTVNVTFTTISSSSSHYIRLIHRNALETWSSVAVDFSTTSAGSPYDFTTAKTQAFSLDYGINGMHQMSDGPWAILSGDMGTNPYPTGLGIQDGNIDSYDFNFWDADNSAFNYGYLVGDLNGDVNVDSYDYNYWDTNNANFEYVQRPF